jgi:hypothetical protein
VWLRNRGVNLGCEGSSDCVLDGFTCETVAEDGLPHCVHKCTDDAQCLAVMPGTSCLDNKLVGAGKICVPGP